MSIAQGPAASGNITTGQNFVLITSQLKIKLIPKQKVRRFEGRLSAESLLFETCVIGRELDSRSKSSLRFCKAAMQEGLPESFTSQIIRQAQCLQVTNLSLWFAQVHSVQNNISKSALHKLVCIIASLLRTEV